MKILLVDDYPDFLDSLKVLCQLWGHEVEAVQAPALALSTAVAFQPDVILLDLQMPGLDGWEIARQIRRHHRLENTILIAITGIGQQREREKSKAAGFNAHLLKPLDPGRLKRFLRNDPNTPHWPSATDLEELEGSKSTVPEQ